MNTAITYLAGQKLCQTIQQLVTFLWELLAEKRHSDFELLFIISSPNTTDVPLQAEYHSHVDRSAEGEVDHGVYEVRVEQSVNIRPEGECFKTFFFVTFEWAE
jgi:hypothetical protein